MKKPPLTLLLLLAASIFASASWAFNTTGARWVGVSTTFHVDIPGVAPSGQTWSAAFEDALTQWSEKTAFDFLVDRTAVDPCRGYSRSTGSNRRDFPAGIGDGQNSAGFRNDVCGNDFGSNVLAITLTMSDLGSLGFTQMSQSDIIFNSNLEWDIYKSATKTAKDFGRVALHEIGHSLGLDHQLGVPAIMAPTLGNITTLQDDDIAGANAIYKIKDKCLTTQINVNARINDALKIGDCRIMDLFGGSDDTSFVDVYKFKLDKMTFLNMEMKSSELDAVLIIAKTDLSGITIFDDFGTSCDPKVATSLPAGEYLLLANSYVDPKKCGSNTGTYSITITDTRFPLLGLVKNASGNTMVAAALFSGAATAGNGTTIKNSFTANEAFNITAQIAPDPLHVGLTGSVYVLVTLGNGKQFVKDRAGKFELFKGALSTLAPYKTGPLAALEKIQIADNLTGINSGLVGQSVSVHVGYAIESKPLDIYYGSEPIKFSIDAN